MGGVTAFDYVLLAAIGTLAIIGLFKGLSGWLGTLTGAAAATVVGYFGFGFCLKVAMACPWVSGPFVSLAAAILDFLVYYAFIHGIRMLVSYPCHRIRICHILKSLAGFFLSFQFDFG